MKMSELSNKEIRQKVTRLKQILVEETSEDDVRKAWAAIKDAATKGVSWASTLMFDRLFGKSLPGVTASMLDQAAADRLRDANLSVEQLEQLEKISERVYGNEDGPKLLVAPEDSSSETSSEDHRTSA
jgi:hypothetical protein